MMNAIVYKKYGGAEVLQPAKLDIPTPASREVLVRIKATTVTSGTVWMRTGKFPGSPLFTMILRLMNGISGPRKQVTGYEFSGVVQDVGREVSRFKIGDEVYGTTTGLKQGAYAEYVCIPENWRMGVIEHKPATLNFEEAAALPVGGMTAFHLLSKAGIRPGVKVLVYGASGSVGSYGVQIARYMGADVTGVCSTANIGMVSNLGAVQVIDYKKEDLRQYQGQFNVVFDAVGKIPASQLRKLLAREGRYCSVRSMSAEKNEYLQQLHTMIAEGRLRPFIDRIYSLQDIQEAHRYVEQGHKRGNVVIIV